MESFEDVDVMGFLHEIPSSRKSRRAAANDCDFFAGRRRLGNVVEIQVLLLVVGDEALEISDAQRLDLLAHQAAAFAVVLLRANAAGDGGEYNVFSDPGSRR